MSYTIVYVDDDDGPECFGTFETREAAQRTRDRWNRQLDEDRDPAGGGAGDVYVRRILPLRDWNR